jgi:hypothetical protein
LAREDVVKDECPGVGALTVASRSFPPHMLFGLGEGSFEVLALPGVEVRAVGTPILEG